MYERFKSNIGIIVLCKEWLKSKLGKSVIVITPNKICVEDIISVVNMIGCVTLRSICYNLDTDYVSIVGEFYNKLEEHSEIREKCGSIREVFGDRFYMFFGWIFKQVAVRLYASEVDIDVPIEYSKSCEIAEKSFVIATCPGTTSDDNPTKID